MKTKKVFSTALFEKYLPEYLKKMDRIGDVLDIVRRTCEGRTRKELEELGFKVYDLWFKEVETIEIEEGGEDDSLDIKSKYLS